MKNKVKDAQALYEMKVTRELERIHEKYKGPIRNVRSVFRNYQGRSMTVFDEYAMGKMLENYSAYLRMIPEAVSQTTLGRVLPTAIDIISAAYVTSIMPAISSIQPMDELVGVVFFKTNKVGANTTFGPTGQRTWAAGDQYSSDYVEGEVVGTLAAGSGGAYLQCSGVLANTSIRPGSVIVKIQDVSASNAVLLTGLSDSNGYIFGPHGLTGQVNHTTGAITVEITHDEEIGAVAGDRIAVWYNKDFEANAANIPKLSFVLTDTTVRARIFMLEGQWGLVTDFTLQKRFGRAMDVEVSNDLKAEINAEVGSAAIQNMMGKVTTNVNHQTSSLPANTSAYEHRMMFRDAITNASTSIFNTAGKGRVSYMICGSTIYTVVANQPGFKALSTGNEIGPHVAGMLDDITIIKAPGTSLVGANVALCGYRGANWFESGVVYAPYLPLFVTGTVNIGSALQNAQGAAHAAAIETVVPEFLCTITLT